ncbi:MAG: hypothetical protein HLUCCA01_08530 [Bacteroidetes bacterium HLUCCA01]|nr:MAG: hypothetical protein HLUCCA01_08530 [Bacteroidetes bacterium HLUCCA01]
MNLRNTVTALWMVSLLSVVFSDLVIVASWKLNEAYIARTMCVERDVAESDCGGTCYLTAQLEARNNPEPDSVPLATLLEQSRSLTATLPESMAALQPRKKEHEGAWTGHETPPSEELVAEIFHPPRA